MGDEVTPVELKEGLVGTVVDVTLKEGETSPPDYLTESDLIGLVSVRNRFMLESEIFIGFHFRWKSMASGLMRPWPCTLITFANGVMFRLEACII